MLKTIGWRIYQDFLMPSRLRDYNQLLRDLTRSGYEFLTMRRFARLVRAQEDLPELTCLLRNDVDTDPRTALAMSEAEHDLGIEASYYFRLSTMDRRVMRTIVARGSEIGYHYEELATVAKRMNLKSSAAVADHMGLIKDEFRTNISRFAEVAGALPDTVAAHGDLANRRLKMTNTELLDDELRNEFGILAEAYDLDLEQRFEARIIDRELPIYWSPETPYDAIARGARVIRLLVHPGTWRCNRLENLRRDLVRVVEGVRFGT
jgi:hypothetical protein